MCIRDSNQEAVFEIESAVGEGTAVRIIIPKMEAEKTDV